MLQFVESHEVLGKFAIRLQYYNHVIEVDWNSTHQELYIIDFLFIDISSVQKNGGHRS